MKSIWDGIDSRMDDEDERMSRFVIKETERRKI
jgi:hypothetical protein